MVEPEGVIVAVGKGFTVTIVGFEVAEQPFAPVTVTVYEPELVTGMEGVVAPVDQR